jgi:hypothetical protein
MAQRPVEKHYGRVTLQERGDGYYQMNIPPAVVDDQNNGLEAGDTLRVLGMILPSESYVRIEGVSDE